MKTGSLPDREDAEAAIYAALQPIFLDIFRRDVELSAALSARDVEGWDSFRQIEILIATEQQFGFKFGSREIDGLRSVGDLVAIVAKHRTEEGSP